MLGTMLNHLNGPSRLKLHGPSQKVRLALRGSWGDRGSQGEGSGSSGEREGQEWAGRGLGEEDTEVSGQQLAGAARTPTASCGGPGWALGGLQDCILECVSPQADP